MYIFNNSNDTTFTLNNKVYFKEYFAITVANDKIMIHHKQQHNKQLLPYPINVTELSVNEVIYNNSLECANALNEFIFNPSNANSTFSIVEKIDELISVTQDENNETQELLKEIQLIPVDFELGEGTYDKSNILTGHYSGSETKIHSIQVLSQDAGAFSLRFVGDVNHNFNENMQQVKAVKNQELADFELVVNPEHNITINLELLTI